MNTKAKMLIETLALEPHPEGGFYRRIYASPGKIVDESGLLRHQLTSIYYLLCGDDFSAFHHFDASEVWYYLEGSCALEIHELSESDGHKVIVLDPTMQAYQYGVQPGKLFAARLSQQAASDYVLVACAVGPGFEYSRYEMPSRRLLLTKFPQYKTLVESFTASDSGS